jgi:hypothetical protein
VYTEAKYTMSREVSQFSFGKCNQRDSIVTCDARGAAVGEGAERWASAPHLPGFQHPEVDSWKRIDGRPLKGQRNPSSRPGNGFHIAWP